MTEMLDALQVRVDALLQTNRQLAARLTRGEHVTIRSSIKAETFPGEMEVVHATIAGLRSLRRPEDIARGRGRDVHEIAPRPMLEGMAEAELAMAQKRAEAGLEDTDA